MTLSWTISAPAVCGLRDSRRMRSCAADPICHPLAMSSLGRPSRNILGWRVETKGVAERHTLEEPNNLQSENVSGPPRPMSTRRRSWPPCPHTFLRRRRAREACSSKPFADQTVRCVIASRWPFASQKMCAWLWPSSGFPSAPIPVKTLAAPLPLSDHLHSASWTRLATETA